MKKFVSMTFLSIFIVATLFCFFGANPVMARAGGSTGGGRSSGGGRSTGGSSRTTTRTGYFYGGGSRSRYSDDDDGSESPIGTIITTIFVGSVASFNGVKLYRQKRRDKNKPHNTYVIDDELDQQFSDFFYEVEEAWAKVDLNQLSKLMTPHYYKKQARIINNWRRLGKVNRLENLGIVSVMGESTDSNDRLHIVVTAQARDFFEYPKKSAEYNQEIANNTYIQRFSEVWEIVKTPDGWLLDKIREIDIY